MKIKNKGLLLGVIFLVFIVGIVLYDYFTRLSFANQAEMIVSDYIKQNISGQYLTDVADIYNDVHHIESWNGDVYVRWSSKDEKMLCVESHLVVQEDTKKQIVVNDIFVLEKEQEDWKINWHGISQ